MTKKKQPPPVKYDAPPFDADTIDWLLTAVIDEPFITTRVGHMDTELNLDARTAEGRSVRRLIATIAKLRGDIATLYEDAR